MTEDFEKKLAQTQMETFRQVREVQIAKVRLFLMAKLDELSDQEITNTLAELMP